MRGKKLNRPEHSELSLGTQCVSGASGDPDRKTPSRSTSGRRLGVIGSSCSFTISAATVVTKYKFIKHSDLEPKIAAEGWPDPRME